MSRAYGSRAQLLGAFESVYGTSPATGFIKFPFVSDALGSEQGLIESDILGQGRDPAAPSRDVIKVEGDMVVPVDLRNFGHWLKGLLGAPVTTGTEVYSHVFSSGAASLPSLSLELGMPEIPSFLMCAGVVLNSMNLKFERSGTAKATINAVAQSEDRASSSAAGTPSQAIMTRFNQFQGYIKKNGTALANIVGAEMTYSNNLEKIETIRDDGKIDGADPTVSALTGSIDVRFAETSLIDAATNGESIALEFGYAIDADQSLIFSMPSVYLPKPKLSVSGPGGVQASFNWQAAKPASGAMMTVTLKNDVSSYA